MILKLNIGQTKTRECELTEYQKQQLSKYKEVKDNKRYNTIDENETTTIRKKSGYAETRNKTK
jgi:hypothetical protein